MRGRGRKPGFVMGGDIRACKFIQWVKGEDKEMEEEKRVGGGEDGNAALRNINVCFEGLRNKTFHLAFWALSPENGSSQLEDQFTAWFEAKYYIACIYQVMFFQCSSSCSTLFL